MAGLVRFAASVASITFKKKDVTPQKRACIFVEAYKECSCFSSSQSKVGRSFWVAGVPRNRDSARNGLKELSLRTAVSFV